MKNMPSKEQRKFNAIERKVYEDMLHDIKIEISCSDESKDIAQSCSRYYAYMRGVIDSMQNILNIDKKMSDKFMKTIEDREAELRYEVTKYARSIA